MSTAEPKAGRHIALTITFGLIPTFLLMAGVYRYLYWERHSNAPIVRALQDEGFYVGYSDGLYNDKDVWKNDLVMVMGVRGSGDLSPLIEQAPALTGLRELNLVTPPGKQTPQLKARLKQLFPNTEISFFDLEKYLNRKTGRDQ